MSVLKPLVAAIALCLFAGPALADPVPYPKGADGKSGKSVKLKTVTKGEGTSSGAKTGVVKNGDNKGFVSPGKTVKAEGKSTQPPPATGK